MVKQGVVFEGHPVRKGTISVRRPIPVARAPNPNIRFRRHGCVIASGPPDSEPKLPAVWGHHAALARGGQGGERGASNQATKPARPALPLTSRSRLRAKSSSQPPVLNKGVV